MKHNIIFLILIMLFSSSIILSRAGGLDPTFSGDGVVITNNVIALQKYATMITAGSISTFRTDCNVDEINDKVCTAEKTCAIQAQLNCLAKFFSATDCIF